MPKNGQLDPADKYIGDMDALIKKSEERKTDLNIYQRMHEAMKDIWYVKKREGDGYYSTVEHDDVTRKIRPALIRHGIVAHPVDIDATDPQIIRKTKYDKYSDREYEQIEYFTQAKICVKFVNIDNPEDYLIVPSYAHGVDQAGNATGKAISYAIKYAFLKAFNLETGDQEDRDHLVNTESDANAVAVYNMLGEELFGDEWEEKSRHKIYVVTKGKTAEADRAPTWAINEAIKNLYKLKKKKFESPEKDINKIDEEEKKANPGNDIISDFQ